MKLAAACLAFGLAVPAAAGAKLTAEWTSPHPALPARKILVVAAIEEPEERRIVEDAVARELQNRGIPALAAHRHLTEGDLADDAARGAKTASLGVDGRLSIRVLRTGTELKSSPAVGVGVGVPVRIGGLGIFVGGSLPIGGRGRAVAKAELQAEFFRDGSGEPVWTSGVVLDLAGGTSAAADDLARLLRKRLTRRGLLPKR